MFTEIQLSRYAEVLFWGLQTARKAPFEPGDIILVRTPTAALPLAERLHAMLLEKGFHPVVRLVMSPPMEQNFYTLSSDDQLTFSAPGETELFENLNGSIYLHAPESLTHLKAVDPSRIATFSKSRKPFKEILDARDHAGNFSWTLCLYPTPILAETAGMGMAEYTEQVCKACFLDDADPVARWQGLLDAGAKMKAWLSELSPLAYHVKSDNIDLTVSQGESRRWLGLSGHNVPSFELFMSPDWRGVEGTFHADQASFRNGRIVRGVRLEFKKGEVVKATAEEGEDFLKAQLDTDEGARRVGEFSITDNRFSGIDRFMANTLYDENFGGVHGNSHIAIGSAYMDGFDGDPASLSRKEREDLGFNDSALHWDLVNTEPKTVDALLADGSRVRIYENGQYQYPGDLF